jgi:hypothetical protein
MKKLLVSLLVRLGSWQWLLAMALALFAAGLGAGWYAAGKFQDASELGAVKAQQTAQVEEIKRSYEASIETEQKVVVGNAVMDEIKEALEVELDRLPPQPKVEIVTRTETVEGVPTEVMEMRLETPPPVDCTIDPAVVRLLNAARKAATSAVPASRLIDDARKATAAAERERAAGLQKASPERAADY